MIHEIEEHFKKEYPREGCGVIAIVKGKKKWFPCTNVAQDDEDFIISSQEYFKIKVKYDILAIVHSHPDASNEASQFDIDNCNALGLSYYIFSYPEMDLNILEPKQKQYPIIGREYKFGVHDCFEALRDWLDLKNIKIPPRAPFEDDWWKKGLNYFCSETIKQWNHVEVKEPKENDVLIFTMESNVPNHCGVYIGNDTMFHHAVNRLSCRESLYPLWAKYLTGVYRYDANSLS